MKRVINEDTTIPDMNRQVAGMGIGASNPADAGAMRAAEYFKQKNEIPVNMNNKPYPIDAIDNTLADMLVNIINLQKLLELAKLNPVMKDEEKIDDLDEKLKKVANILVDFNQSLSIIKGNE